MDIFVFVDVLIQPFKSTFVQIDFMSSSKNSCPQTGLLISADIRTLRQSLHMTRVEFVTYKYLLQTCFLRSLSFTRKF